VQVEDNYDRDKKKAGKSLPPDEIVQRLELQLQHVSVAEHPVQKAAVPSDVGGRLVRLAGARGPEARGPRATRRA